MTTKKIPLTAVSVQFGKPNTKFGQLSILPISSASQAFVRAPLTGIPATATVQQAILRVRSRSNPFAGTRTLKARYLTGAFSTKTTWNTRPGSSVTGEVTLAKTNAPYATFWELDVTTTAQAWISGTLVNYGWTLFTGDTNIGLFQGVNASWGPPELEVTYVLTAQTPTGLHPSSGAVSLAKPTLTFQAGADTTSIQVQVDASANTTTPAFDSGEVAATAGLLDLAAYSVPRTVTIGTTSGSATITGAGGTFSYLDVGQSITGTGIPGGATITAVASGISATISANATVTGSPSATIARIYLGLADAASTQWRARAKNALDWSAWSSWVTFSRAAWKTLTVTSPTATSEDPSPVVTATYGGTITAWRVLTKDSLGALVEDSDWTPGSTVAYGTTRSVGIAGTAYVQVRDNILRDATPGDPDYVQASQAFTVTPSGSPTVIASVAATSDGVRPWVTITGTRVSGVPDEVVIYRDNVLVDRVAGADIFSGTAMTYLDKTVPMNVSTTYKVYAVVNGNWSNASSTVTLTPKCIGLWILDTTSSDAALILGDDDQDQTEPEIAVVHRPISGAAGQAQVVRRRLSRYPREGSIGGLVADAMGVTAAASETALRDWIANDAGHIYRLVMGNRNDPVILGDIDLPEVAANGPGNGRVLTMSASWWYQS